MTRFVLKAVKGEGWRVWNTRHQRFWGQTYTAQPDALLAELNGAKRSDKIVELSKVGLKK
jgi:hypothetical protein